MREKKMIRKTILTLIFFVVVSFVFDGKGYDVQIETVLQIASFIFGIFVAFYIVSCHSRFNEIAELLQQDNGISLSVYLMSSVFGSKVMEKVKCLLGDYYIAEIDYFLVDYRLSNKEFMILLRYVYDLNPENEIQSEMYSSMIQGLNDNLKNRKRIESLVRARISFWEWIILVSLLLVMLYCFFYMSVGVGMISVMVAVLSTMSVVMLLVLYDLDSLDWQYEQRIWGPLQDTLREFGHEPYYPRDILIKGRVRPEEGKIRVAFYPDDYPEMSNKVVKIIEVGKNNKYMNDVRKYSKELM